VKLPFVLVSDVDGTLLGDDAALDGFCRWYVEQQARIRLVYASGRFYESIVESIQTTGLPPPDAIIGGVGTEIRAHPTGEPVGGWQERFSHFRATMVRACLSRYEALEPQPVHLQSAYKVSYFAIDATEEFLAQLRSDLQRAGCPARIVYSSRRDLDVLPPGVDKGAAAEFLIRQWGVEPRRVMVSGDSGNDLSMFGRGYRGIVVGNAHDDLKALRGDGVFHSRRTHAAGVLEGLQYWLSDGQP